MFGFSKWGPIESSEIGLGQTNDSAALFGGKGLNEKVAKASDQAL